VLIATVALRPRVAARSPMSGASFTGNLQKAASPLLAFKPTLKINNTHPNGW
jgi:hypothetical protein